MPLSDSLSGAGSVLKGGFGTMASYAWVLIPIAIIIALGLGGFVWKTIKKKKSQWTHKLKVRRVLKNKLLSDPVYINMRRFPLIKQAETFELEKPLLGSYLFPEVEEYSGDNEYSIILDKNNRIYTNKGEYFDPKSSSTKVSAKHSAVDIAFSELKSDFQNINKLSKRVEWATVAKYAFFAIAAIVFMIVAINGLQKWGESQKHQAAKAQAEAAQAEAMVEVMLTMKSTVNAQKLEILPMMKEIYQTKNIQSIINTPVYTNGTS